MAFYDYKCKKCSAVFEISKGMNETVEAPCPACGCKDTQRVFSVVRTLKGAKETLDLFGSESSSSGCDTCTSGVCSTCSCK